ncbi:CMRF35-like molecule 9 isoform X5 [Ornithorhynchus anatinus]|uniref:CMRF35-like molecule 9 isoform X5 n=1 Tax=Ornithorhynchus anatinus TaxID=9258 RepID=UPI0019D4C51B|nr:CMRF35-like molecule 9 isoform X5 [Ornithorhynchus anatinus]XP_039770167.1 CMRF35-like molecule 9 isoform X5 [Ornithorhynchus anatinus]
MGSTGTVRLLFWTSILFPGVQALSGPEEAEGPEGGSLTLRCVYKDGMQSAPKYWCRAGGLFLTRCSQSVKTSGSEVEATNGPMSIRDSHRDRAFTVTMKELTTQDAGHYLCGVERFGFDDTLRVTVTVSSAFPPSQPGDPAPSQGRTHHATPAHRGTKTEFTAPTRDHPTAHSTASRGVTSKEEPRVPLGSSDPEPRPDSGRSPRDTGADQRVPPGGFSLCSQVSGPNPPNPGPLLRGAFSAGGCGGDCAGHPRPEPEESQPRSEGRRAFR